MQQLSISPLLSLGQAALAQQGQQQTPYGGLVQQAPQTVATAGAGGQPLGAQMDPRSQYVQALMSQMGKGENSPKTAGAVGSDLLAQALMRYGANQQQNQQQSQQLGQDWANLQAKNQAFQDGLGLGGFQGPQIIAGF